MTPCNPTIAAGLRALRFGRYDLHGGGRSQNQRARRRAFEYEGVGHSVGALVDWERDARAEATRRKVPEKRARSGFRVGLSHDSTVVTYR